MKWEDNESHTRGSFDHSTVKFAHTTVHLLEEEGRTKYRDQVYVKEYPFPLQNDDLEHEGDGDRKWSSKGSFPARRGLARLQNTLPTFRQRALEAERQQRKQRRHFQSLDRVLQKHGSRRAEPWHRGPLRRARLEGLTLPGPPSWRARTSLSVPSVHSPGHLPALAPPRPEPRPRPGRPKGRRQRWSDTPGWRLPYLDRRQLQAARRRSPPQDKGLQSQYRLPDSAPRPRRAASPPRRQMISLCQQVPTIYTGSIPRQPRLGVGIEESAVRRRGRGRTRRCPVCMVGRLPARTEVGLLDLGQYRASLHHALSYNRACPLCQAYVSVLTLPSTALPADFRLRASNQERGPDQSLPRTAKTRHRHHRHRRHFKNRYVSTGRVTSSKTQRSKRESSTPERMDSDRGSKDISGKVWRRLLARLRWQEGLRLLRQGNMLKAREELSRSPRRLSSGAEKAGQAALAPITEEGQKGAADMPKVLKAPDVVRLFIIALSDDMDQLMNESVLTMDLRTPDKERQEEVKEQGDEPRRKSFYGKEKQTPSVLKELLKMDAAMKLRPQSEQAKTLSPSPQSNADPARAGAKLPWVRGQGAGTRGSRAKGVSRKRVHSVAKKTGGQGRPSGTLALTPVTSGAGTPAQASSRTADRSSVSSAASSTASRWPQLSSSAGSRLQTATLASLDTDEEFPLDPLEVDALGRGDYFGRETESMAPTDESYSLYRHNVTPTSVKSWTSSPEAHEGPPEVGTNRKMRRTRRRRSARRTLQTLVEQGFSRPLPLLYRQPPCTLQTAHTLLPALRLGGRPVESVRLSASKVAGSSSATSLPPINVHFRPDSQGHTQAEELETTRKRTETPVTAESPTFPPRSPVRGTFTTPRRKLRDVLRVKKAHVRQTSLLWSTEALETGRSCAACRHYKPCILEQSNVAARPQDPGLSRKAQRYHNKQEVKEKILEELRVLAIEKSRREGARGSVLGATDDMHWRIRLQRHQAGLRMAMMLSQMRKRCSLQERFSIRLQEGPPDSVENDSVKEALIEAMEASTLEDDLPSARDLTKQDGLSASLAASLATPPLVPMEVTWTAGEEELEERLTTREEEEWQAESYEENLTTASQELKFGVSDLFIRTSFSDSFIDFVKDEQELQEARSVSTFGMPLRSKYLQSEFCHEDVMLSDIVHKEYTRRRRRRQMRSSIEEQLTLSCASSKISPHKRSASRHAREPIASSSEQWSAGSSGGSTELRQLLVDMQKVENVRVTRHSSLESLCLGTVQAELLERTVGEEGGAKEEPQVASKKQGKMHKTQSEKFAKFRSSFSPLMLKSGPSKKSKTRIQFSALAISTSEAEASEIDYSPTTSDEESVKSATSLESSVSERKRSERRRSFRRRKRKEGERLERGPQLTYGAEEETTTGLMTPGRKAMLTATIIARFAKFRPRRALRKKVREKEEPPRSRWLQKLEFPYYYLKGEGPPPDEEELPLPAKKAQKELTLQAAKTTSSRPYPH